MSDTIGPDGLTDEERSWRGEHRYLAGTDIAWRAFQGALADLAAERLAHAETRAKHSEWSVNKERRHAEEKAAWRETVATLTARAEKAEAEQDRLRAALELVSLRQEPDGPCWCVFQIPKGSAHHISCLRARALLGEVKP
jgi:hypothetical protein